MKKILYIISKQIDQDLECLISSSISPKHSISAILIQEGVTLKPSWTFPYFVLEDYIQIKDEAALCSKIQYSDMVRMISVSYTHLPLQTICRV